jgi:hypothetical protein
MRQRSGSSGSPLGWLDENVELRPGQWEGTVMATWKDRGLTEYQENQVSPRSLALGSAFLTLLVALGWALLGSPILPLPLAVVGAVILGWPLLHREPSRDMTLSLGPQWLRLEALGPQSPTVLEFRRADAGTLTSIRGTSPADALPSGRLELRDIGGHLQAELIDRMATARSLPHGPDGAGARLDSARVPLSVLIGTWWPEPSRRVVGAPARSRRGPAARLWDRPSLGGYRLWSARTRLRRIRGACVQGLLLAGASMIGLGWPQSLGEGGPLIIRRVLWLLMGGAGLTICLANVVALPIAWSRVRRVRASEREA